MTERAKGRRRSSGAAGSRGRSAPARRTARPARPARPAEDARAVHAAARIAGVTVTHPDRVLYREQGLTKLDLARYMESVAKRMLPHVEGRPLMLLRCPEGSEKQCFFQKHPSGAEHPSLARVRIQGKEGTRSYLVARDTTGLVSLVQMGVLEVHVWGARAERLEQPDRIAFDVDPDPSTPWREVVGAAVRLREDIAELGLESFVKTTGGKGLHVVVPIRRGPGWEEVKQFSAGVAARLVRESPELFTTRLAKERRGGRIFLDTLRNRRGATWVAPYSARARAGAPVSFPLEWSDVGPRLEPKRFTVATAARLLAGRRADPWQRMGSIRQALTAAALRTASAAAS